MNCRLFLAHQQKKESKKKGHSVRRAVMYDINKSEASLILPSHFFVLFFREGFGALHHGNEPLVDFGASLPHDLPSPPAQTCPAEGGPEKSHLSQQEFPGFAAGSRSSADKEKENLPHIVDFFWLFCVLVMRQDVQQSVDPAVWTVSFLHKKCFWLSRSQIFGDIQVTVC